MYFEKASIEHKDIIFKWLDEPHVKEFWDNSQDHKDDIINFINGTQKPSGYFEGIFNYWIGSINNEPYCFLLTSPASFDESGTKLWNDNISKTGKTFTIDFCIGNKSFLSKGLAAPTLKAFIEFFRSEVDPEADTFFIDPDESNTRAKHVYAKAGFNLVGDFIAESGAFIGKKSYLMVKNLTL